MSIANTIGVWNNQWIFKFMLVNTPPVLQRIFWLHYIERHFLACEGGVNYTLSKVGGWKNAILSGEGIVMTFEAKD